MPNNRTAMSAVALRLAGAGFDEVAEALGLSDEHSARHLVIEGLSARAWEETEGRQRLRQEAAARIERLLRSVWPKALDAEHPEHLPAVRVARELIDRGVRLYGLDAPTEVVVHSPTVTEIDAWVARVLAAGQADMTAMEAPVVAELIEAEVIEEAG